MARTGSFREKIRTLLIKASDGSATEAERQGSYLLAQKLMLEHNITEEELRMEGASEETIAFRKKKYVHTKPLTNFVTLKFYQTELARVIAPNFRCHYYVDEYRIEGKKKRRLMFLGLKADTEIAAEVFEFAVEAIVYLADQYIEERKLSDRSDRTGIRNDYMHAFIKGLEDKFNEQVASDSLQVALAKHELVESALADLGLVNKKGHVIFIRKDKHAIAKGYKDGKNLNLDAKRVESGSKRLKTAEGGK